jgi:hypothetical protein
MEMLALLDRICTEHGILYYLGAAPASVRCATPA